VNGSRDQWSRLYNVAMFSFRLRQLGWFARLGVAGIVLTLLGGLVASAAYVHVHHAKRDGQPGLSMTDLIGSYHGIDAPAPLLTTLKRGHPEPPHELDPAERQALIDWLQGDRIAQTYDDLDLGDFAPAEIIAFNCIECHARRVAETYEIARTVPLDYWDDVSRLAFPLKIDPPPMEILIVTTHTHALSLATISVATMLLLLLTSWPRRLVGFLIGASGIALLLDISSWWLARLDPAFVYVIVIAGGFYLIVTALAQLVILLDLALPECGRQDAMP
jgi:hypothetical protein